MSCNLVKLEKCDSDFFDPQNSNGVKDAYDKLCANKCLYFVFYLQIRVQVGTPVWKCTGLDKIQTNPIISTH